MNGQCGALSWATHGLPLLGPMGTCNKLPRGARVFVPHRAPDSKIQWAPWMANEGQSHGQHMGCQWCGPWGLATSCHVGTTYLALLMPIWASMGPMYVCHHSANKIPWGAYVCASRNTNITGDRKGHLKRNAVARPGKYAETGSCKYLCHAKVTWNKSVVRPRNGQETGVRACDKIIPTHMCLYCNLCRIWLWHYM